jgi:hypothetical protein
LTPSFHAVLNRLTVPFQDLSAYETLRAISVSIRLLGGGCTLAAVVKKIA